MSFLRRKLKKTFRDGLFPKETEQDDLPSTLKKKTNSLMIKLIIRLFDPYDHHSKQKGLTKKA
jgi:hypothetical protein